MFDFSSRKQFISGLNISHSPINSDNRSLWSLQLPDIIRDKYGDKLKEKETYKSSNEFRKLKAILRKFYLHDI